MRELDKLNAIKRNGAEVIVNTNEGFMFGHNGNNYCNLIQDLGFGRILYIKGQPYDFREGKNGVELVNPRKMIIDRNENPEKYEILRGILDEFDVQDRCVSPEYAKALKCFEQNHFGGRR